MLGKHTDRVTRILRRNSTFENFMRLVLHFSIAFEDYLNERFNIRTLLIIIDIMCCAFLTEKSPRTFINIDRLARCC